MSPLEIDAEKEREAASAEGKRLYHVVVVQVHPRTGERLNDEKTYLTGYPMRHEKCMTFASRWTPRRGPRRATTWRLEEVGM